PRISSAPVREVRRWIVRAGHPDGAAAALPRLATPRLAAWLVGARDRPEPPGTPAGLGIVGVDEATDAVLRARHSEDHLVLHDERRDGGAVALLDVIDRGFPEHGAAFCVHGDEGGL